MSAKNLFFGDEGGVVGQWIRPQSIDFVLLFCQLVDFLRTPEATSTLLGWTTWDPQTRYIVEGTTWDPQTRYIVEGTTWDPKTRYIVGWTTWDPETRYIVGGTHIRKNVLITFSL